MRAALASGSFIHAVHVWMTAHGRPTASSSASHSAADFSRNLASKSSATLHDDGKLKPIGSARLRSSNGAEVGSYGSRSTMPNAATSSEKPRYLQ